MVKFKEMKIEDIDEVVHMYVEAFNSKPWNEEWSILTASKRLHQMINCESSYGILLYEEDDIIGMILGSEEQFYNGVVFNIKEFCIKNEVRNRGFGKVLFEEFEKRLIDRGVTDIILNTLRGIETEGFYKKRGLKELNEFVVMGKKV